MSSHSDLFEINYEIHRLEKERESKVKDFEFRIENLKTDMRYTLSNYDDKIELLKKRKANAEGTHVKIQDLKNKLVELYHLADGGENKEDGGVLKSFLEEMKKIILHSDDLVKTLHLKDILDNLDPSWYHPDIEASINEIIKLYDLYSSKK